MTLTRVQALALALGLVLIGVAAAWGDDSAQPLADPTELNQSALERGDLAPEQPAPPVDPSRFSRDVDFDSDFRIQQL